MNLEQLEFMIKTHGPSRVIINEDGEAVPMKRARELGATIDIIYIRNDGWSFGASNALKDVAYKMWEGSWVAYWKKGESTATRYVERE